MPDENYDNEGWAMSTRLEGLENTINNLKIAIVHLKDDKEILRSSVIRRAKDDRELLISALHALEHNKPHVVKDHLERVRDSLMEEINKLRQPDDIQKEY